MTYDDKYPHANDGDQPEGEDVFRGKGEPGKCWMCEHPTAWIDLSFQTYLCSEECSKAAWDDYFTYCREHPWPGREGE